jgi:L-iditol 2-dehydrogenase
MKQKVSFLHGPRDLRVVEHDVPSPGSGQVLIEVMSCGICGSDVECFEGHSAEGRYDIAPYTPGHEWSGRIVEMGPECKSGLALGDKVVGDCVMGCGKCYNCKEGRMPSACLNFREIGFRPDSPGGMGEYMVVEEEYVHKFPDSWSFDLGAWHEPFSIGYFGIWGNGGYIDASDTALIFGAGPIGMTAQIVAQTSGARTMVADPLRSRRDRARAYGADEVIDPTSNFVEQVMDLTGGHGANVMVECSGNDKALASLFDVGAHSARVRLIGHSVGRQVPVEIGKTIWRTLSITGSGGTKNFAQRTIRFMDRIKDTVDITGLTTHHFAFERIHDAFDVAVNQKAEALKVMLHIKQ